MRSGDRPGLQNRRAASSMSPVGSTPTRFRQFEPTDLAGCAFFIRTYAINEAVDGPQGLKPVFL